MINQNCCVYCGDWYQCRDHVIPVSYNYAYKCYHQNETVLCCSECNTMCGDRIFDGVEGKSEYLLKRYNKKYKKHLECPTHTKKRITVL